MAAQKEAASAAEAAQKARIEELEAELLRQQARAAEAEASPRSAYGTPAKGQGHVSEENDNLAVELEAALGDEGEGACPFQCRFLRRAPANSTTRHRRVV